MLDSSCRTPPFGTKKPRMQSQDERDAEGFAARKERDVTAKDFAAEELAKVEVEVEIDKEQQQQRDTIAAKKMRREILKGVGLAASGGGLVELLHRLGVL